MHVTIPPLYIRCHGVVFNWGQRWLVISIIKFPVVYFCGTRAQVSGLCHFVVEVCRHTQLHTHAYTHTHIHDRTPLNEWSVRRIVRYVLYTTGNMQKRRTCSPQRDSNCNPSNKAAVDLRLRPYDHQYQRFYLLLYVKYFLQLTVPFI